MSLVMIHTQDLHTHTHIFKREHFLNEGFYVGVSFSKTALVICNPLDTVEFCVLLEQLAHVGTVSHHAFQLLVDEVYSLVFWAAKGSMFVVKFT